jgi:general stress protein YciG
MSGTKEGGARAAATNMARHGNDFYKRIGTKGGSSPKTRPAGFAVNRELARVAGCKGGLISRRGKSKKRKAHA